MYFKLLYVIDFRVLDVEPETDEDEDSIIERRRQLRQAIVNKYHQSAPTTPPGSSPAPPSDADSDAAGERIEEELKEEGRLLAEAEGDKEEGLVKNDPKEEVKIQEELKKKKTSLSALRDAIRNGDMFSEENLFTEMVRDCGMLWCSEGGRDGRMDRGREGRRVGA